MDFPIAEKQPSALRRVADAINDGAHMIDVDDVRELLDSKLSAVRAYENHIAWQTDQLVAVAASARTGGSRELVANATSIWDRLVNYAIYIMGSLPMERKAEANKRANELINGLRLLVNGLEDSRRAQQYVRLQRNQLEAELAEARLALDASQGQVKLLEAEVAELRDLVDRQVGLLSRTAVAIRGPEPELARWSHHDLPELAQQMRDQRNAQAELLKVGHPAG